MGADPGASVAWYAVVHHIETGQLYDFSVVGRAHVDKRRDAGAGPKGPGPAWRDWYDEMALGKAAREALRFVPMSPEAQTALATDGLVRTDLDGQADDYVVPFEDSDDVTDEPTP